MANAITKLDSIKGNIIHGDVSELTTTNGLLEGVLSSGNSNGVGIKESTDTSTGDAG
ncbi:hypothetical protein V3G39_09275 [Dermatophilaceae bacterium Sec6.4]